MLEVFMLGRRMLKKPSFDFLVSFLFITFLVTVSLPGAVTNAYSSVTLNWTAPTTNTDGTPLTDLQGYKVYYGSGSPCNYTTTLNAGNVTTHLINLASGTYCFAVTAYDTAGNESAYSNIVYKTEAASDTTAPT